MNCFPCCVTVVPPFSLPAVLLRRIQSAAPATRPEGSVKAFQLEWAGAAGDSPKSAPGALPAGTKRWTERPGLNAARPESVRVREGEPELDAGTQPGPPERVRSGQGLMQAAQAASAAVQTAGQGQASTQAKNTGAHGSPERTGPVVEPGLYAGTQPGPQETVRPGQGLMQAAQAASAAVQTAGQGQASTQAKNTGAHGSPEHTGPVVELGLGAGTQPGPQERVRPGQGPMQAAQAASAAAQTAGQGQASTPAKPAGAEGLAEWTDSVVAQASDRTCGPAEPGAQSRGEANNTEKGGKTAENSPSGPVLERTSLAAGSARDVAFAVKCSEAAPAASASNSMPLGVESGETTGSRAAAGVLRSGSVAEPATLSGKLPACPPVSLEATGPVASAGREGSAGTGNQPRNGFAEQGESPDPRKLMGAALKEEGTTKPDALSGKQSTLQAGSGPGTSGMEKGSLAVAAPPASQAAPASSHGSGNAPTSRTAPELGTLQSPAAASEPGAVQSPGRIDLRVQGQQNERVDIRLVARGSEVQVTVKTASAALTTELRGGLQDLVQTLRDSGYQTEAWRPSPPGSPASNASNDAGREQGQPHEGGQSGRESASGWQQENRGDRGRQDNPPRWVEELEASSAGSPHTNWRELSWRQ